CRFDTALAVTRAGNLFTTHTAVAAGFDRFSPSLVEQYLGAYAREGLGLSLHALLALGRENANDSSEPFNMAFLAIRGSGAVNGVSQLHGAVSRQILAPLFPRWPQLEVPVGFVTNGIHVPTWDSAPADALWTKACGKDRWLGATEPLERDIRGVSDAQLWQLRENSRDILVDFVRQRLGQQLTASGATPEAVESARRLFDGKTLTLGFARRFATYKRPNLLLQDPERLLRILNNRDRPVQLIMAGKAHPADQAGQDLILQWMRFINHSEARAHVAFLSDYDMHLTEQLVQGVDVWINTPRRPWEACGTSGMKVLVNGGLNLSVLDGWWAEAYAPDLGWALGDGREHDGDPAWDATEALALYDLLEHEVIPEFYQRDQQGVANVWVKRMRESMSRLTPQFSSNRAVREYTERHYLPAASTYRARAANRGAIGAVMSTWRLALDKGWNALRFGAVQVESDAQQHIFEVQVFLDEIEPNSIQAELYADAGPSGIPVLQTMKRLGELSGATGGHVYSAAVPASRPATDYTVRLIPHHDGVAIPLEDPRILWQR
ncbi:MAG: alpha-glucan family phosphorylase, partial [Burkholderiaceae bacterium]